jgi:hypothetical protein
MDDDRIAELRPCKHVKQNGRDCFPNNEENCQAFWHTQERWVRRVNEALDIAEQLQQRVRELDAMQRETKLSLRAGQSREKSRRKPWVDE